MLTAVLLSLTVLGTIYFKFIVPFYYWERRGIFYIKPWTRFRKIFLSKTPFVESVRSVYNEHHDRRYFGSYQFLQPSLLVRDIDLIKRITVKDFEHFTDHSMLTSDKTDPILGLNLFSLKGQKWREMRSTLSPAFTGVKMRSMYGLISDTAKTFTRHFLEKSEDVVVVEMRDIFTRYTNDVIANCAFGIKCDSLIDKTNEFYKMGRYVSMPTPFRLIRSLLFGFFPKIFEHISRFFLTLIKDAVKVRENEGIVRPDMIHLLMEARKGRLKHDRTETSLDTGFATVQESEIGQNQNYAIEITDEVITAQALVFFIAGFTTSSSTLSFMAYELAINPEIQKKLQREIDDATVDHGQVSYEEILKMKYLDQVVTEALRKYPPGYVLNRICTKDYVIQPKNSNEKEARIEKGCLVAVPVIGIHYDPQFFTDPDRFNPDRFSDENRSKLVPGTYMPFGMGPRNCIGSRFALLEIKVLLVSLLSQFDLVPVKETVIPLQLAKSLALEPKGGIWLGLQHRK